MTKEWFASWFDSRYYPVLYQHRDYSEAEAFLRVLINSIQPPANSRILDLACGRGRHAFFLQSLGFQVTGIDLSPESIQEASKRSNDHLQFFVRDMREPFQLGTFDLILNLFTSFGYFDNPSENQQVLENVKTALQPDGLLVLDYLNAETTVENLVQAETKILDGITFEILRFVEDGKIIKEIQVHDGDHHPTFRERVQALTLEDFENLTQKAGLVIEKTWGDYAGNPYEPGKTPRLILFCRHKRA